MKKYLKRLLALAGIPSLCRLPRVRRRDEGEGVLLLITALLLDYNPKSRLRLQYLRCQPYLCHGEQGSLPISLKIVLEGATTAGNRFP